MLWIINYDSFHAQMQLPRLSQLPILTALSAIASAAGTDASVKAAPEHSSAVDVLREHTDSVLQIAHWYHRWEKRAIDCKREIAKHTADALSQLAALASRHMPAEYPGYPPLRHTKQALARFLSRLRTLLRINEHVLYARLTEAAEDGSIGVAVGGILRDHREEDAFGCGYLYGELFTNMMDMDEKSDEFEIAGILEEYRRRILQCVLRRDGLPIVPSASRGSARCHPAHCRP